MNGHPAILVVVVLACFAIHQAKCSCKAADDWMNYKGLCLKYFYEPLNYNTASIRCLFGEGADLVSISTEDMLEFVTRNRKFNDTNTFWVGLRTKVWYTARVHGSRRLQWEDGTFPEGQPWVVPLSTGAVESCYAYTTTALVAPFNCTREYGYICARKKPLFNPEENCRMGTTNNSFIGEESGRCIYRTPDATDVSGVDDKCHETDGEFVDVDRLMREGLHLHFSNGLMVDDEYRYWTGLKVNGSSLFWKNGDLYLNDYDLVRNEDNENATCVQISFSWREHVGGKLYQMDCNDHAHVFCAALVHSTTTVATPTALSSRRERAQISLCPQGHNWKVGVRNGDCFWETSFETRRLTWDEARLYCQGYGGDLASLHSVDEERIGLSFQYGSFEHSYWIGLRLDLETETYKWSDGSDLDYENWAPNHPDHKDKRLQCVAMDASGTHWISSFCGIMSWFVCRAPKRPNPPPPVIPTREPLIACDTKAARPSIFYFDGYCYEVVTVQYGWHRAKEYCEDEGFSLVSIHSDAEISFLLRMLYENRDVRGNRVWIGLESLTGVFRWTDWSPVDLTYWNEDEPNNYLNQEKCGNMYVKNGLWNDENCNEQMMFICKQLKDATVTPIVPSTPDPTMGNCRKGWYAYRDKCFLPYQERVNWTTANDVCQSLGGYLVSIRDEKEQTFLSFLMQGLKADTWIGLHDTIQSGRYFWMDNSYMRYTNWAVGEPSFFGYKEDCVKMVYDDVDSGVWKDDLCMLKFPFICQVEKDRTLPKPDFDRGLDCLHPEGWLKFEDMCFKVFVGSPLSWPEAEMACQRQGAHLASLSVTSVQAVARYLGTEINQTFWIGLEYQPTTQEFTWLNGWPMTMSKWDTNALSTTFDPDSCYASAPNGFWERKQCTEQLPYICQITTGKGPVLRKHIGGCPKTDSEWIPTAGSYCHLYDKSRAAWISATLTCFRHGSFLISLHSLKDLEMVKKSMAATGRKFHSVYIGLMRNAVGGFFWSDHSPVNFVNWEEGQSGDDEPKCVEMMADTLKWRLTSCSAMKNFICAGTKDEEVNDIPENEKFVDGSSGGLSVGALTAILVGCFLLIIIVLGLVFFRPTLGRTWLRIPYRQQQNLGFDNALYNVDSSSMEFQNDRKNSCDST